MKKLTIKEKMEIAEKLKNKPNYGYKKIASTFDITVPQAGTIKNNMHILTSNDKIYELKIGESIHQINMILFIKNLSGNLRILEKKVFQQLLKM